MNGLSSPIHHLRSGKFVGVVAVLLLGAFLQLAGLVESALFWSIALVLLWVGPGILAGLICRLYDPHNTLSENDDHPEKGVGAKATVFSVLAAGFGVNSAKNYAHDSQQGSLRKFIVAGIYGTLGFIAFVLLLVKLSLSLAA